MLLRVLQTGRRGDDDLLPRELLLAAACCRWPLSQARNAAVSAAAAGIDWNSFLQTVRRQRVAGLVHEALSSARVAVPDPTARALAAAAGRIVLQNLALAAETVRLQRAFEAAGVALVVLKGVALAQLAYGSLNVKHARDIDLLVSPDCAEAALGVLAAEGYALCYPAERLSDTQRRAVFRFAREVTLVHCSNKFTVELQWRLTNNPLLLRNIDVHSPTQNVAIANGHTVRTLASDDLFAYLCAHGAQHAWSRLKWLADLNALIAAGAADCRHLYLHAQAKGAGVCAGQALLLCRRLFDLALPAGLLEKIRSDHRSTMLVRTAIRTMADPYAEAEAGRSFAGLGRVMLSQFLLGNHRAFYAAEWRVASVRTLDLIDLPLPPRLHFLYPLLRLPLWLRRRLVPAWGNSARLESPRRQR